MISGTYVLTDTIDKAFDNIFTSVYAGTDAVITGEEAFETDFGLPPPFPESLLEEVRALPDVGGRGRRHQRLRAADDEGRRHHRDAAGRRRSRSGRTRRISASTRPSSRTGSWADSPDEVVIDAGDGRGRGLRGRRHDRRGRHGAGAAVHDLRPGRVRRAGVARRRHVRHLHAPESSGAVRQGGRCSTRISIAAREGVSPEQLVAADRADPPAEHPGADGSPGDAGRDPGRRGVHEHHPVLPARVRLHRPVRRRLRHLQHAVDHGRPARARVRDAADDRRVAAAGAAAR